MGLSPRDVAEALKSTTDAILDKVVNIANDVSRVTSTTYDAVKRRTQVFVETGIAHYQQTEEQALGYFKDGLTWMGENELATYLITGTTLVLILPRIRRPIVYRLFRYFRSDESVYRSAEARLESVQGNLKRHNERTEQLDKELPPKIDAFVSAQQQLKKMSQELNSFSNQIHKDIRLTYELLRDMKEMPSKPSMKMQSDAAMTLSDLERQNRQVDNLLYKVMQKGI